jgi:hypothetical protein
MPSVPPPDLEAMRKKVFVLAVTLIFAWQAIELCVLYADEALIVGLALAIVPYLVLRCVVNQLASTT